MEVVPTFQWGIDVVPPIERSTEEMESLTAKEFHDFETLVREKIKEKIEKLSQNFGTEKFSWDQSETLEALKVYRRINHSLNSSSRTNLISYLFFSSVGGALICGIQNLFTRTCDVNASFLPVYFLIYAGGAALLGGVAAKYYDRSKVPMMLSPLEKVFNDIKFHNFLRSVDAFKNWSYASDFDIKTLINGFYITYDELTIGAKKILPPREKWEEVFNSILRYRGIELNIPTAKVPVYKRNDFISSTVSVLRQDYYWTLRKRRVKLKSQLDQTFKFLKDQLVKSQFPLNFSMLKRDLKTFNKIVYVQKGKLKDVEKYLMSIGFGNAYYGFEIAFLSSFICTEAKIIFALWTFPSILLSIVIGMKYLMKSKEAEIWSQLEGSDYTKPELRTFVDNLIRLSSLNRNDALHWHEILSDTIRSYDFLPDNAKKLFPLNTKQVLGNLFSFTMAELAYPRDT